MGVLLPLAVATKHNLFVGGFGNAFVYSLEFDDEALTLNMVKNISSKSGHSWIALSHDKTNLYGVETGGYVAPAPRIWLVKLGRSCADELIY